MKITEKITATQYIGQKEIGVYEGTRYMIDTEIALNEGDVISIEKPIEAKIQTLCQLCAVVYDGGEDYSGRMKLQAIDFYCGFITREEIEIEF